MWLEDGRLVVRQRSPRSYDGVDVTVDAPADAKLLVKLIPAEGGEQPPQIEVPLGELSNDFRNVSLDGRGNRLLVRRTPGDQLRVRLAGDSLVFSPGEKLRLEVEPCLLPAPADAKLTLRAQLSPAGQDRELWSAENELPAAPPEGVPLEIPLPQREGVYDVLFTAMYASSWPRSVASALNWKRTVAERKVQLVVIDPRRPPPGRLGELSQVVEIDSANPRWWDLNRKLPKWTRLTRWSKTSAANGDMQTARHVLGELTQLNPSGSPPDVSWHAYTLSLSQPGRPHVLEVEYPSDMPQTLGLSILEPNAAGVPGADRPRLRRRRGRGAREADRAALGQASLGLLAADRRRLRCW